MKPITIIGGGLAGLTLGIFLRRDGVPATIIEAGHYPRHRVCGEFISGAGVSVLDDLGILQEMRPLDTRTAHDAAFFSSERSIGGHRLPRPALCISRFVFDAALSSHFQKLGGELREGERWRTKDFFEGVVCAAGRRAQPVEDGVRWCGLKVHARNVPLVADLEMHLSNSSYVGLCRLPNGEVNVCGLFRRQVGDSARGESMDWLRGAPGSPLFARLQSADFDMDSFCAVGGLSLRSQTINERECRIGDALTMIPPITGNGMSMAFESARLALNPLLAYARGGKSWPESTMEIAQLLRQNFAARLRFADWVHRLMFSTRGASMLHLMFRCAPIWRAAFSLTR